METLKTEWTWRNMLQVIKDHRCQTRLLYPLKLSTIVEQEKELHNTDRLKEFVSTKPNLQRVLQTVF